MFLDAWPKQIPVITNSCYYKNTETLFGHERHSFTVTLAVTCSLHVW